MNWKTIILRDSGSLKLNNNQLTLISQNRKQLDFQKPDIVIFFGLEAPEKGQKRNLYFITNWDYIDNDKLYVQLECQKDPIWLYLGNYLNSRGHGKINRSLIGHEHSPHDQEDKTAAFSIVPTCSACEDCFDFCPDLRVKRATPGGYKRSQEAQWQPQYGIIYSAPTQIKGMGGGNNTFSEVWIKEAKIKVPTNLQLNKWAGEMRNEGWYKANQPALLFLVDRKHYEEAPNSVFYADDNSKDGYAKAPDGTTNYYHELPEIYNEQPHLLNHSSTQFFFQKKLLFTANLRHLAVGRKITPNSGGKPIFVVHYKIYVMSSVAGILYKFQSGDIFYRWELDVRGSVTNNTVLSQLMGALSAKLFAGVSNVAGNVAKGLINGVGSYFGLGKVTSFFTGGKDKKKQAKHGSESINDLLTADKYEQLTSTKSKEGRNQEQAQNEQQTERMKKSTAKSQHRIIEPSLFYTNTVDFNYDFWEFANRIEKNPFTIRFEHSEVLCNNLKNNNQGTPIRNLDIRFSAFKQCLVPGYLQGNFTLWWDTDGFFAGLLRQGVFFYHDLKNMFKPWRYQYKGLTSYTAKTISGADSGQGEELVEVIPHEEKIEETIGTFNSGDAHASFDTYFRVPDDNLYQQIVGQCGAHKGNNWNKKAPDKRNAVCWGCSIRNCEIPISEGGTIYTYFNNRQSGEEVMEIPDNCTLVIDTDRGEFRAVVIDRWNEYNYHYQGERHDTERDEDIAEQDYNEPIAEPTNTQGEVEIEIDDDEDKEDLDLDEDMDIDGDEKDEEEDIEINSNYNDNINENANNNDNLDDNINDDVNSNVDDDEDDNINSNTDNDDNSDTEDNNNSDQGDNNDNQNQDG